MPLLRINASPDGLTFHDTPQPVSRSLRRFASHPGPAIVMVHGYKYQPGSALHCPHDKIFNDTQDAWPAQLRLSAEENDQHGLGIALGWDARGPLRHVHAHAAQVGKRLAQLVKMLHRHAPDRPVHVVAHSLGSEVALSALQYLPAHAIDRMILLTGASYAERARRMLHTDAGKSVAVLNITSRENDVFDMVFERLVPPEGLGDCAIGQGINTPNVATVQIDCPHTLVGFRRIGFDIAPPRRRICHWSAYTRPGLMAFYDTFLRTGSRSSLDRLIGSLPAQNAPRWSRFVPRYAWHLPTADQFLKHKPAAFSSGPS